MALIVLEKGKVGQAGGLGRLELIMQSRDSDIRQWLQKDYPHEWTLKSLGQSQHIRSTKGGFEIETLKGQIETVFVYFRTPKFNSFEGVTKFGINKGWVLKGAVSYLGQPPIKNPKLLQIIYPHLGLGIVFQGTWSDEMSHIEQCYLYNSEGKWACGGCGKEFTQQQFQCVCGIVQYCSQQCKKKHYGYHLIFCQLGKPQ